MKKVDKYSCKFPDFVEKVPGYSWYQGLDKRQKSILMHAILATGAVGMTLSGYFGAIASGSYAEVGGTMLTGGFIAVRNLVQAWQLTTKGETDIALFEGRQALRKNLAFTSRISAVGYTPQFIEGIMTQDPIRILTAASAGFAYLVSDYRYRKSYKTWESGTPYKPSRWLTKLPGNLLISRSVFQTGLAYDFYQAFGVASGLTLAVTSAVQIVGAMIKKDADNVLPLPPISEPKLNH